MKDIRSKASCRVEAIPNRRINVMLYDVGYEKERKYYDTLDDLPVWMKERIAVLSVMHECGGERTSINSIGRYYQNCNVYWLEPPEDV